MTTPEALIDSTSPAGTERAPNAPAESLGQRTIAAAHRITDSNAFQWGVIAVILLGALLVALEVDGAFVANHAELVALGNLVVQVIFTIEVSLRLLAQWRDKRAFLRDGWNLFDLAIVILGWIPGVGSMLVLGRVVRLVRVLRLASFSPRLRMILDAVLRSLPSLGHVVLLIGLLVFVYSILGVMLFGAAHPEAWGSLGHAALNVFQILTMEGWTELMAPLSETHPWAWVYFLSFIIFGGLIIVNLFVGVVLDNMQGARDDARSAELRAGAERNDSLAQARLELRALHEQLARVQLILDAAAEDEQARRRQTAAPPRHPR